MSAHVSDEAYGAMVAALTEVIPDTRPDHIGALAVRLTNALAEQLGGYLLDPKIVGLSSAYVLTPQGDAPARELYLGDEVGDPQVQWLTENGWADYTEVEA